MMDKLTRKEALYGLAALGVGALAGGGHETACAQEAADASSTLIDVKRDFGAKGDGVADDTRALQAALDALPWEGGTIHVPVGAYRITETLRRQTGSFRMTGEGGPTTNEGPRRLWGSVLVGDRPGLTMLEVGNEAKGIGHSGPRFFDLGFFDRTDSKSGIGVRIRLWNVGGITRCHGQYWICRGGPGQ